LCTTGETIQVSMELRLQQVKIVGGSVIIKGEIDGNSLIHDREVGKPVFYGWDEEITINLRLVGRENLLGYDWEVEKALFHSWDEEITINPQLGGKETC